VKMRPTRFRRLAVIATAVAGMALGLAACGGGPEAGERVTVAKAAASWPVPTKSTPVTSTIPVSGTYDGGLKRFYGSGALGGDGQDEGQDPIFKLADGAVLKNVILGTPAADGVHCTGSCTLQNVWWEDVGEDAATFKGKSASAVYTVTGGGARKAADKVFQFNGAGKLSISKFQVADFGKLVRSCGNCSTQYTRTVALDGVEVTAPGKSIVGINSNFSDTATLRNIVIYGDSAKKIVPCERYKGVTSGEPTKIGSGPDGTYCRYTAADITYK
jgi:pectate lyase